MPRAAGSCGGLGSSRQSPSCSGRCWVQEMLLGAQGMIPGARGMLLEAQGMCLFPPWNTLNYSCLLADHLEVAGPLASWTIGLMRASLCYPGISAWNCSAWTGSPVYWRGPQAGPPPLLAPCLARRGCWRGRQAPVLGNETGCGGSCIPTTSTSVTCDPCAALSSGVAGASVM